MRPPSPTSDHRRDDLDRSQAQRVRRAIAQRVEQAISRTRTRVELPHPLATKPRNGPLPAPRLLLVEDDAEVRAVLIIALRTAGFAIDGVGTRAEGEACLVNRAYDALILDALLPDGSGIDMAREWGARGFKALVITGSPDAMSALEAQRLRYLPKPFNAGQIVATVERLLTGALPSRLA